MPARLLTFVATVVLTVALAACGTGQVTSGGPTTAGRATATGRAQALQACQRWSAAGKGPGSSALTTHRMQAAAANEEMRAAGADPKWRELANAMMGSVRLPLAMLTPRQESEANADLATIRSNCARLGVAVAGP